MLKLFNLYTNAMLCACCSSSLLAPYKDLFIILFRKHLPTSVVSNIIHFLFPIEYLVTVVLTKPIDITNEKIKTRLIRSFLDEEQRVCMSTQVCRQCALNSLWYLSRTIGYLPAHPRTFITFIYPVPSTIVCRPCIWNSKVPSDVFISGNTASGRLILGLVPSTEPEEASSLVNTQDIW